MTSATKFDLVHHVNDPKSHDTKAAGALLAANPPQLDAFDLEQTAKDFKVDERLRTVVNTAIAVGAPLLLTGEPGSGKTQLAYHLAWYFGIPINRYQVRSTSTSEALKFDFDAVAYLRTAHHAGDGDGDGKVERSQFLDPGPLWHAYDCETRSVLLIDEIDKAPRDFPNDLLHELAEHEFEHPFHRGQVKKPRSGRPPIVVITSNIERRLPDAFLRRCIYHHIEVDEVLFWKAVKSRRFPNLDEETLRVALDRFLALRDMELQKLPSTAELLLWLAILDAYGIDAATLRDTPDGRLPGLEALVKDRDDLRKVRGSVYPA